MPSYIITIKQGQSKDEVKKQVEASGGKITHDYTLINAFSVDIPDGVVTTFENHPDVECWEEDKEVKTQ